MNVYVIKIDGNAIEESKWGDKDTAFDRVVAILNRLLEGSK